MHACFANACPGCYNQKASIKFVLQNSQLTELFKQVRTEQEKKRFLTFKSFFIKNRQGGDSRLVSKFSDSLSKYFEVKSWNKIARLREEKKSVQSRPYTFG